jgi:serine/threonine protein kinase
VKSIASRINPVSDGGPAGSTLTVRRFCLSIPCYVVLYGQPGFRLLADERDPMKYCPTCQKTFPADYNVCPADQTSLQNARELQPGMIIRNKYEILDRIGVGGMGVVYRVRHLTFNEVCAIKIVNDVIAGDTNFLQRFQKEAVVTRKLRHPNAVRVDDFDYTEDGRPFIVMELVEGKNIGEILQEQGPFRVPRAIRIATQVARALGVAHKLGVVHRDIKPGNILLTTDEQGQETAKVLDFGIAKLREAVGDANAGMTITGMVVGTPLYMSPEQFMGKKAGEEIDGRTDLYSLGVVLYQMVTAQLPFEGDTLYSLMMQHIEGTVRPPHELVPELHIPEALSQVILKAIDKSRDQRFQTAEEFIAALDQVANDEAANSATPSDELVDDQSANIGATSLFHGPQGAPIRTKTGPSAAANLLTPPVSAALPFTAPDAAQPSVVSSTTTAPPADSVLVKSAAQHLFLQPRRFRVKHFLILMVLGLAAVIVAGVGYLKYQSFRRMRIENAVNERLNTAPSPTLRQAAIRVFVSDAREVILDGNVSSPEDLSSAATLAASVPGVTGVTNRIGVIPALNPAAPSVTTPVGVPAESADSLIKKGSESMDAGDYSAAIDCFRKAAADPNNKGAAALLDRAQRAQKTEKDLLRKRQ